MKIIISELGVLLSGGKVTFSGNRFYPRVIEFIRILLLALLLSLITGFIMLSFFKIFDIEKPVNIFLNSFKQKSWIYQISFACLYAPIVEELQFRLCLKYSKINFAAFSGIWLYYFLQKMMKGYGLFGELNTTSLAVALSLILVATVYSFLCENKEVSNYLEELWRKYYKVVFYISVISFGFIHMTNFDLKYFNFLLTPIITLPQTSLGFLLGYVRLKYGLLNGIFLHSAFNFFLLCIQL